MDRLPLKQEICSVKLLLWIKTWTVTGFEPELKYSPVSGEGFLSPDKKVPAINIKSEATDDLYVQLY